MISVRRLKRAVPAPLRPAARGWLRGARAFLAETEERLAAASRAGAGLYYGALSSAFSREHRAVAAGRLAYRKGLTAQRRSSFLLRRNVHRLEKGLIATERRRVFALDFIGETVTEFEAVAAAFAGEAALSAELRWAHDVLTRYFGAVDLGQPEIRRQYARFSAAAATLRRGDPGAESAPFRRDLTVNPVDIDDLGRLAVRRRSVRHFIAEPVSRDVVDRAVAVAAQSPSACNRQAFRFLLFDDPAEARAVAAVPAGTKTFVAGLPSVAVVVGRLRAYPRERDRHAIYVDGSLASMAFIFALEAQGVASCAINWADEEPAESRIARLLSLAPDERVIMMIAYGWPDPEAEVPYSAKRELDELREYASPCMT